MDIYMSDVQLDGDHPDSVGDSLSDKLEQVFGSKFLYNGSTLREVLSEILDEIIRLRKKLNEKVNIHKGDEK